MTRNRRAAVLIAVLATLASPAAARAGRLSAVAPSWLLAATPKVRTALPATGSPSGADSSATSTPVSDPLPRTGADLTAEGLLGMGLLAAGFAVRARRV